MKKKLLVKDKKRNWSLTLETKSCFFIRFNLTKCPTIKDEIPQRARRAVFDMIGDKGTEEEENNDVIEEREFQNIRNTFNRTQRKLQRKLNKLKRQKLKRLFLDDVNKDEEWNQRKKLTYFYLTKI